MSEYLVYKGITQYEFSKRTKLSNGFLNSGDNITSDSLDSITNVYLDLNLTWLVKGIGPMLKTEEKKQASYTTDNTDESKNLLREDTLPTNNRKESKGDGKKTKNLSYEELLEKVDRLEEKEKIMNENFTNLTKGVESIKSIELKVDKLLLRTQPDSQK